MNQKSFAEQKEADQETQETHELKTPFLGKSEALGILLW